jgi:hypothetical protein
MARRRKKHLPFLCDVEGTIRLVGESTELVCVDRLRAKKRRDSRPGYTAVIEGLGRDADGQAKFRATPEEQQEEREPVRNLL